MLGILSISLGLVYLFLAKFSMLTLCGRHGIYYTESCAGIALHTVRAVSRDDLNVTTVMKYCEFLWVYAFCVFFYRSVRILLLFYYRLFLIILALFSQVLTMAWGVEGVFYFCGILVLCTRRGIYCIWVCAGLAFRAVRAVSNNLGKVLTLDFAWQVAASGVTLRFLSPVRAALCQLGKVRS